MRWTLERVTEPEQEPVTLTEAKRHLRLPDDLTDADDDVEALIKSGREWAEDFTGRALFDQQWRLSLNSYLGSTTAPAWAYYGEYRPAATGEILLRRSPILEIVSVSTYDAAGEVTVEDDALYEIRGADSKWPRLYPLTGASWGSGEMQIVYRAGYANTTDSPGEDATVIPERFKLAIKLHVEAHFDRDEKMMALLLKSAEELLKSERCDLSMA